MDAHLLRRFWLDCEPLLKNARLEKIQAFTPDVTAFLFYTELGKRQLCLRSGRQGAFLFLSATPVSLGQTPPASIMRLRKHLLNRRLVTSILQPFARKLWMLFQGTRTEHGLLWLLLDLKEGVQLLELDENAPVEEETVWPDPLKLKECCENWRNWPVLTPQLRKTLPLLEPMESRALLCDLKQGGGDLFLYTKDAASPKLSAWPLPLQLHRDMHELQSADALALTEKVGQKLVFQEVMATEQRSLLQEQARKAQKLKRLAQKIDEDEARLKAMCAGRETALLLQQNLWRLDKNQKCRELTLEDAKGSLQTIPMDPRLTTLANMQRLFHQAERGKRGLEFLAQRRAKLLQEQKELSLQRVPSSPTKPTKMDILPQLPTSVQAFISSDGFLLLRGRSAKGNLTARKFAKGHDLWLHAAGGPGAHVIIRLQWPGQQIPERTLKEAGILAALKSWQKEAANCEITYAEVRHIKPMKGAAAGTVRIDKVWHTRTVSIDPSLEERLCVGRKKDAI